MRKIGQQIDQWETRYTVELSSAEFLALTVLCERPVCPEVITATDYLAQTISELYRTAGSGLWLDQLTAEQWGKIEQDIMPVLGKQRVIREIARKPWKERG